MNKDEAIDNILNEWFAGINEVSTRTLRRDLSDLYDTARQSGIDEAKENMVTQEYLHVAIRDARIEALEEAAGIAEERLEFSHGGAILGLWKEGDVIAKEIRQLKEK